MFFHYGRFCQEWIGDSRLKQVMQLAVAGAGSTGRASDVVEAAIRGDETVARVLARALPHGTSPGDLALGIRACRTEVRVGPPTERRSEDFSEGMIKALSAYTFASARDGQMPSELGLEVLLSLVLAHADEQDRQFLRPLDTGAAAGLFREQVVRQISEKAGHNGSNDGAQVSPESESTSILPVGLCPSEDLTALARVAGSAGPFPFDDAKEL